MGGRVAKGWWEYGNIEWKSRHMALFMTTFLIKELLVVKEGLGKVKKKLKKKGLNCLLSRSVDRIKLKKS